MKRIIFTIILISSFLFGFSQNDSTFYKKGIYKTFSDFKNKIPNESVEFTTHQLKNNLSIGFQLRDENNKRIKKAFAVSDGKTVFVKVKEVQKLVRKNQKVGTPLDSGWDFMPSLLKSKDIIYFENYYVGIGTQIFGGKSYLTGIIYNFKTENFTVLSSNDKINEFITEFDSDLTNKYSFSGKTVDLNKVRKLINEIITGF
ncbi:hypothetical protein ACFQ0R_02265 [Psychroflexus salinarum]|uniref:GLPGLI family protein n=1 Tax=Psychroflexus salinarum TaxID=546024 RepID=A0ABW3GMI6_9FLAO